MNHSVKLLIVLRRQSSALPYDIIGYVSSLSYCL